MAKMIDPAEPGGPSSKKTVFALIQRWAEAEYPAARGQGRPPSGARIFYFARLAFLRLHPLAHIEPDMTLADPWTQAFLEMVPSIAEHLATEYKRAVRLSDAHQGKEEMQRFLRDHSLAMAPPLNWAAEHVVGIHTILHRTWQDIWKACWQQPKQEHEARLWSLVQKKDLLLVIPVAAPSDPEQIARQLLDHRLEQDRWKRTWVVPPPEVYVYDCPLEDWLLQPLLSVQWFWRLCQALAELAQAVPALVRKRAAGEALKEATGQPTDTPSQESQRRVPPAPTGTPTARAIFAYAVSTWRLSAGQAGEDPILPESQRLFSLKQFRALLALAINATEQLLWDDTPALHALPAQSPARRDALRQALLPPRLRAFSDDLKHKAQRRQARTQAAPLPRWEAWETTLHATLDLADKSLERSTRPDAALDDLLRQPRSALVGQYLYQSSLREWLRAAFPVGQLDGFALLAYYRLLAEALGAWPPNTPGAPASAEQAARAIFWYCKLSIEPKIDSALALLPSISSAGYRRVAGPPQREDGGLVIWLTPEPLPPEALELATASAPLIARVLYESSWEAAKQGEPLLAAGLKMGDQACIDKLLLHLERRARFLQLPNTLEALQNARDKLQIQLERFMPPADITNALLMGDIHLLESLDIFKIKWYIINNNDYKFFGGFLSYACSFIRHYETDAPLPEDLPEETADEPFETSGPSIDLQQEDRAAIDVLTLLAEFAESATKKQEREDARLLVDAVFTNNSGRGLIQKFAREREPVASTMIHLWQAQMDPAQKEVYTILPSMHSRSLEYDAALARFLYTPAVQRAPERRRAVADLFERGMNQDSSRQTQRLSLGTLERLAAWAMFPPLRAETLRALDALAGVPREQRQMLCAHLLGQEPTALTLKLLEQSGWTRPDWLRIPGPGAATSEEDDTRRQLYMTARRNWASLLTDSPGAFRARALTAEWLNLQFWNRSWQDHLDKDPYALFYRTMLGALHPRLRQIVWAAFQVATEQKLASFSEIIGLTGCLPPQLPAQIDHPAFFRAMLAHVTTEQDEQEIEQAMRAEAGNPMPLPLRRLRRNLRVMRWRTFRWFVALAGLPDDNQQRILLASMSLVAGKAEQLDQWMEGMMPSQTQLPLLLQEVKRWHHQTSITEQTIPSLLPAAAAEVRPVWQQLRRPPRFWIR